MSTKHTILLILVLLSVVLTFVRGVIGHQRTYDGWDALGAVIEGPIWVWLLVTG